MATLGDVSSEEEDIFGGARAVSFYAQKPAQRETAKVVDDDDDDDDDLELPSLAPKSKRKRGRTRAHAAKASEAITIDSDSDIDRATPAKAASVFSANTNSGVVDVDNDTVLDVVADEVNTAVSKTQIETERLLQKAKHERHGISLEAQLEKEATMEAQHQALILDRQREMERKRDLEEKAAADRAAAAARKKAEQSSPTKSKEDTGTAEDTGAADTIVLRVRNAKKVVKMKILKAEPLLKMLKPFCEKIEIDPAKAVMEVDGEEVEALDTADTYELEDNNIVEVRLRK